MTARIDTTSFTVAARRLRTSSSRLQKDLVDNLHNAGPLIEADMRAKAGTPIQQHAVNTVRITKEGDGIKVHGGGGGGLDGILFAGGEFGGRKSQKKAYAARSRFSGAYVVRRRTTMQFLPHLGRAGYFYFPTLRDHLPRLLKKQEETVARALGGGR